MRGGIYSPGGRGSSGYGLRAGNGSNKHVGPTSPVSDLSNFPDREKMRNCTMLLSGRFVTVVSPRGTGDVTKRRVWCLSRGELRKARHRR